VVNRKFRSCRRRRERLTPVSPAELVCARPAAGREGCCRAILRVWVSPRPSNRGHWFKQLTAVRQWIAERWPGTQPAIEVSHPARARERSACQRTHELLIRRRRRLDSFSITKASAQGGRAVGRPCWEVMRGSSLAIAKLIEAVDRCAVKETWLCCRWPGQR